MVVQIDGKVRSRLLIPVEVDDTSIREAALADERIKGWLEGRSIRKVVIVPKKLVNIVTGGAQ